MATRPVPIQLPIGAEETFSGPVDLIKMKAIFWDDETLGAKFVVDEIPADLRETAQAYREKMVEAAAEHR
ncbi:MAG: hypothetical protein MPW14_05035 [Candidatus Manganitrophus sp.]|nr:MAG: hypothetical protein MPW14_05035 [Candidatus Manganitrophus sp.]